MSSPAGPLDAGTLDAVATDLARAQLARGLSVQVVARGGSMWPFLLPGDVLTLAPPGRLTPGLVVWVDGPGTAFGVIHRVVACLPGRVLTKGDALPRSDGWVSRERVRARVAAVRRGEARFVPLRALPLALSWLRSVLTR